MQAAVHRANASRSGPTCLTAAFAPGFALWQIALSEFVRRLPLAKDCLNQLIAKMTQRRAGRCGFSFES